MENNVKQYKNFLLQENDKTNLVSRKTVAEEIDMHIEDSQKVFERWSLEKQEIIDVGSGAGFPGLIMAISRQENTYTLLESELKKYQFLSQAVQLLKMSHVQVIRGRAEELGHDNAYREHFDVATSRAVAAMRVVIEYCLPLTRVGGMVLLWKGPRYEEEIEQSTHALKVLGGKVEEIYLYQLGEDRQRAIIQIRKHQQTPERYPRRTGLPVKRPL
ncbi:rrna small subunit 7-methylguanosine (m7g) methyltransferase gidb [hydrocarbon metagenome]|uniref:Rrna small subunit 7-methylguanosine (M7g) methyltransferase gidb n=1 Tax=hydrocarbon metagenome TaxID=938273 RepID=A0A0W8E2A8_9ZZZZ